MGIKNEILDKRIISEEDIKKHEEEDSTGVRRTISTGYKDGLTIKTIQIIKVVLLVLMPIVFFMYSVLLFPIVIAYGLLYFASKNQERNINYGKRKDLHISYPKMDSLLALILVGLSICVVGISALTSTGGNSQFAGKNEAQIYQLLVSQNDSNAAFRAKQIANSGMTLTNAERSLYQVATLMTGQRELFKSVNEGMTFGGGQFRTVKNPGGEASVSGGGGGQMPAEGGKVVIKDPNGGIKTYEGEEAKRIIAQRGSGIGNMPLTASITQIFRIVSYGILIAIVVYGGTAMVMYIRKQKVA